MKYLITGGTGQLGYDIIKELISRGELNYLAPTTKEMNITNKDEVEKVILGYKPDIIFHCAAYTAVDKAEEDKENCYNINVNGTKNIVSVAEKINAKVVYISTDYVFDGTKEGIYEIDDKTNPINYYGYTKLMGEEEVKKLNPPAAADAPLARTAVAVVTITKRSNIEKAGDDKLRLPLLYSEV